MTTGITRRLPALLLPLLGLLLFNATGAIAQPGSANPASRHEAGAIAQRLRGAILARAHQAGGAAQPLDLVKSCPAGISKPCFTPAQVRTAYNLDALAAQGIDGTGQTVVVIDSYGSDNLQNEVAAFDKVTGLPAADVTELYPLGHNFQPSNCEGEDEAAWAGETDLDVEWIHAIAPGAKIVVLVSPVSETEGVTGMPEFLQLEQYARDNALGSIISQSWGTNEDLLEDEAGTALRAQFDAFYQAATASDMTIFTSSGDTGPLADNLQCSTSNAVSPDWPATVPWLTAVGGTELNLSGDGRYSFEGVMDRGVASGSGVSEFYPAPAEQQALPDVVQRQLNGMRGVADVSAIGEGLLVYQTADNGTIVPVLASGTSASTPIWAAIAALTAQMAGGPLGNINPALYAIAGSGRCFHDVTLGTNGYNGQTGQPALPGWDFPTGWGSPDAGCLVPALVAALRGG